MMSFSALAAEMRLEAAGDEPGIRKVHEAAFGRPDEGRLVDALREGGSLWLSMVMVHEEQIVAHVAWSPVMLEEAREAAGAVVPPYTGIGLGPIGVHPICQRLGLGMLLILNGLQRCRQAGWPYAVVLGHPDYYPRFGFRPGAPLGIRCEFDAPEAFMVLELRDAALLGRRGVVRYRPEFRAVS